MTFLIPLLIINSLLTIGLVLNQNETKKDPVKNSNVSSSTSNPLETITWVCLLLQFFLLLIQTKVME